MLIPLFAGLLSAVFFVLAGLAVVAWLRLERGRLAVLAAFVLAAYAGLAAYGVVYGWVFADAQRQLQSRGAVIGLLVGLPLVGVAAGTFAARTLAPRFRSPTRHRA